MYNEHLYSMDSLFNELLQVATLNVTK